MRLDLNLATRPYEDAREFWTRWGAAVGALGLVTLVLLVFALRGWIHAGRDRSTIRHMQNQITTLDRERSNAQQFLDLPVNRSTRDQSQFLNDLIQRKSFSWSLLFADLERVMPPNVHVVNLKPGLNDDNQLVLNMRVAGDSRSAAIELVHHMESSRHFQDTQLVAEGPASDNPNAVGAEIVAVYIPDQPSGSGK